MGLDMFLTRVKREEVGYWRKANAIHAWFERKLAPDEALENCKEYTVSKKDLIELRDVCKTVLSKVVTDFGMVENGSRYDEMKKAWVTIYKPGEVITNPEVAEELLPTKDGFFFGTTKYNERYIEDLKNTIEIIDNVLETTDFDHESIVYYAWW